MQTSLQKSIQKIENEVIKNQLLKDGVKNLLQNRFILKPTQENVWGEKSVLPNVSGQKTDHVPIFKILF